MTGTVYLVGAGPGPKDLLTLRAARLLEEADVVLHDALVGADVLALARNARLFDVGKRANRPSTPQRFICRLLVRLASRHKTVIRLKGGDPGVFARAVEELDACRRAGLPVVIVPGVSAAFAAAADAGVPLTARGLARSVAFVTPALAAAGGDDLHWARAAAAAETAAVYMGASQAGRVVEGLKRFGIPDSRAVALVENAGAPDVRVLTARLADVPLLVERLGGGPSVMIIGEVAARAAAVDVAAVAA